MMRTIYLDSDYKCHIEPKSGYISVDTYFFDGFCDAYIEGYRYVPDGNFWKRSDGTIFYGEMVAPWKSWTELDNVQRDYEKKRLVDLSSQNDELLDAIASMVEDIYNQDLTEIEG